MVENALYRDIADSTLLILNMERHSSKSLRNGTKDWMLPELDLSEELADDWDLSPTKEQEIRGED